MKTKIIFTISLVYSLSCYCQQWSGEQNTTSTIFREGSIHVGNLNNRQYLRIESSQWPELRFTTPSSNEQIRLGVAHESSSFYNVGEGDFYVFTNTSNSMPLIVKKNGDISMNTSGGSVGIGKSSPAHLLDVNGDARIGNITSRQYLKISSSQWPEIRFETPLSNEQIRLGVAHESSSTYSVGEGDFYIFTNTENTMPLIVRKNGDITMNPTNGSVGIGTVATGSHKLAVEGSIGARKIEVEASGWSDFVFESDYELRTLEEVEQHIDENGHLPDIPSETEVFENGIDLGEMDARLLQKIEELTLYMINMNNRMKQLETENEALKEKMSSLNNE